MINVILNSINSSFEQESSFDPSEGSANKAFFVGILGLTVLATASLFFGQKEVPVKEFRVFHPELGKCKAVIQRIHRLGASATVCFLREKSGRSLGSREVSLADLRSWTK